MRNETHKTSDIANEFELVGRQAALEAVWPDETSRPCDRTFERLKADGIIPFVKIGRMCWYQPKVIAKAIVENHTVSRRFKPS